MGRWCIVWKAADNKDSLVQNIVVEKNAPMQVSYAANELNGINRITMPGTGTKRQLNTTELITSKQMVTAIPYYAWDNRGSGRDAGMDPLYAGGIAAAACAHYCVYQQGAGQYPVKEYYVGA